MFSTLLIFSLAHHGEHNQPGVNSPSKTHGKHGEHGKPVKPVKQVHEVQGKVTAVDAATGMVTVVRHASHHSMVSQSFMVASDAKVKRNDAVATLGDIAVGDHVSAKVRLVNGVLTASRVNVSGPVVVVDPTPVPAPVSPTPAPAPAV